MRIVCAVVVAYCIMHRYWWLALIVTVIGFLSDYIDGRLARSWHASSSFGAFFDPLADKVLTLTLAWLFVFYFHSELYLLIAIVLTLYDVTTTTLRLVRFTGRSVKTSHVAKLKTATLMVGLVFVLAQFVVSVSWLSGLIGVMGEALLGLAAILSAISLKHYLKPSPTVVEQYTQLSEIDFAKWRAENVTCILFDIDGTLTSWRSDEVSQETLDALKKARKAGIRHIGLVSNMPLSRKMQSQAVAQQIEAATYQLSKNRLRRKPNPYMIRAALEELGMSQENTAFVGDKLIDVLAARQAGLRRAAWVEHLGKEDHPLDALLYRRVEPFIKWAMR